MANRKCLKVIIGGRVTGVGFRYSTARKAGEFPGLRGYVRNVAHDQVEVVLSGEANDVNVMVDWLRRGPPMARVVDFKVNDLPEDPSLKKFTIKH